VIAKYARDGAIIRDMMKNLTPAVEPLSIDEAFLDLSGTERIHGQSPAQSLIKLQKNILKEVGVTVSVGLSYNKFLAKTASDLDKPNGFAVLGRADAQDFLAGKPVGFIYGVGPSFAKTLNKEGLITIADVRRWPDSKMAAKFGDMGLHLARQPVQLADVIFRTCLPLLEKEATGKKFRLIGAGISGLTAPVGDSGDLLDPSAIKRGIAERASDKAREKFGTDAVMTGRGFKSAKARENQAYSLPEKIKPDSIDWNLFSSRL